MKISRKSLILCCIMVLLLTGCRAGSSEKTQGQLSTIWPEASGKETLEGTGISFDLSGKDKGYFCVSYTGSCENAMVQLTGPDNNTYNYHIDPGENDSVLTFTAGSGDYLVCAYENLGNEQYAPLFAQQIQVELDNELDPFLVSSQYVCFTPDCEAVELAKQLTEDLEDPLEIVSGIYRYVISNVEYDYEKAATVQSGYLPSVDETLKTKKGICFDFAALMVAMLRSLAIPARLDIGYLSDNLYHAWISVWSEENGWVQNLIEFNGEDWTLMDPTLASTSGNDAVEDKKSESGTYLIRYVY